MKSPLTILIVISFLALALALAGIAVRSTSSVIIVNNSSARIDPLQISRGLVGVVSGYSSEQEQTDDSPFVTASNKRVYDGLVANNKYPFGTKVNINGRVFIVDDRMNRRYGDDNWDIWFPDRDSAMKFGRQEMEVVILK